MWYSGKKKQHTIKSQVVADKFTKKIIFTSFANGKCHDFNLLKKSKLPISSHTPIFIDSGYQGIFNFYPNSKLPHKNTKFHKLSSSQKAENCFISKHRIFIENIFASIKKFKIFSDIYRSRTKRFPLRFNLIASILNFELNL